MAHFIVTASATASGCPLYLGPSDAWSPNFTASATFETRDDAQASVAEHSASSQAEVCDPYTVEVTIEQGQPHPISLRESIRANGPTVSAA